MKTLRFLAVIVSSLFLGSIAQAQVCVGDCDGDRKVEIHELIVGVRISLDLESVEDCPSFDANGDGEISVDELVLAVNNSLFGCPRQILTVSKFEDTNDGVCDGDCSLREAIIAANASKGPSEIIVLPGTYSLTLQGAGEDAAATGDLDITGDMRISCEPFLCVFTSRRAVIDGSSLDRVLQVHSGGTLSLSWVTIQNGSADEGGGIFNAGTLLLTDSIVTENRNPAGGNGGGGIFNAAGVLRLKDSSVGGNSAEGDGGGGILNRNGVVTLTDSMVSDNTADGFGGGIFNDGNLTLENSTVVGNSASISGGISRGGGIFNRLGHLSLTDSTVTGNSADAGGGIENHAAAGTATVLGSTVSDNSAAEGGGINVNRGVLTLMQSTMTGNSADAGGAINNFGGMLTVMSSTLSNNRASQGGGIRIESSGTLAMTNSTLSGNSADAGAGGSTSGAGEVHVGGGIFNEGNATLMSCTVSGNFADLRGGISNGGTLLLTDSIVSGHSRNCGGDPVSSGGHNLDDDGTCNLTSTGDLRLPASLAPLGDYGGPTETHALCTGRSEPVPNCARASPAIDAGKRAACPDTDQRGGDRPQPFDGACDIGAYEANSPIIVTKTDDTNDGSCNADCSLREAILSANAFPLADVVIVPAGTYVLTLTGREEDSAAGDLDIRGDLTLIGAGAEMTVVDGNATDRVFEIHPGRTVHLSGFTIQNGSAFAGGGIRTYPLSGHSLTVLSLTNSTVSGNSAGTGGGISNGGGPLMLANSTVSGNSAGSGGGIHASNEVTLINSTVSGNSAAVGGGIDYYGGGALILANSTVSGNSAENRGGGISNEGSSIMLTNTVIAENTGGNCVVRFDSEWISSHSLDDDGSCGFTGPGDLSELDAHLAPLGDYGGLTDTHALCTSEGVPDVSCTAASPAIDAGDNDECPDTDQRGVERPQPPGGVCDIGAYEAE